MKAFSCIITLALLLSSTVYAETLSGKYELKSSQINYQVTYLIKKINGGSTTSKGKGECKRECEFLVAAPIKSFDSKNSNRDSNMLKATRADRFPLVVARFKTKKEIVQGELLADVEIDFAGLKKMYPNIALRITPTVDGFNAEGKIDLLLDDHQIVKPSLLGFDIKNLVPVTFSADWKKN